MGNSVVSLFLGITATVAVSAPLTAQAATFDYSQMKNISQRPIESDYVLDFFGDINQNQGYAIVSNLDPNAPDYGHISIAKNALPGGAGYYTMGRPASPAPNDATRSATLQSIKSFSNFSNYLVSNNISLADIGFTYGQKSGVDFTKSLNLGEDKLGQDWFASPDSTVEERIHINNPDDAEVVLLYGTTKIIDFGYSPFYFAMDNGPKASFSDNFNVFFNDPVPAIKAEGLDSIASGLADAFLQDVAAGGGMIQIVSEDPNLQPSLTTYNGYRITYVNLPIQVRVVSSQNIPEPSLGLGLLMFGALGVVAQKAQKKNKSKVYSGMGARTRQN